MNDEISLHIALKTEELIRKGLSREEAERRAFDLFGDMERVREECKVYTRTRTRRKVLAFIVSDLINDVHFSLRTLRKHPLFTAVAVITLALGIGTVTIIFSVVNAVLLRPLPYPESDHLVRLFQAAQTGRAPWAGANYVDFITQASSYEAVAGYQLMDFTFREDAFPAVVHGATVTSDFFRVFGVAQELGRVFSRDNDPPGGDRTIVLGHALWQSQFGEDPNLVGSSIELNGKSHSVVGVMPSGFAYPEGAQFWVASQYAVPARSDPTGTDPAEDRDTRYFHAVARLRKGVSIEQARQEGNVIIDRLAESYPANNEGFRFNIELLHETVVGSTRPMLVALFAAVSLVLLIACVNVANLLLVRATSRTREMAIRMAMGAERRVVALQLLTESLLLGLAGGVGGILLSIGGTGIISNMSDLVHPRVAEISVNPTVLGFAVAVSLLSGLLFGMAPVLWFTRGDPASALRDMGEKWTSERASNRMRRILVAAEIALSLALLVGAGLLARTLEMLNNVDPGFSARNVLTARIWLPSFVSVEDDELHGFQNAVLERIQALPSVTSAGAVLGLPVERWISMRSSWSVEGREVAAGREPMAGLQAASPGYFETIGIPVIQGRAFTDEDGPLSPKVAVISEEFAKHFFPDEDPLGKRIGTGNPQDLDFEWMTIVGVVGSTRPEGLDSPFRSEVFQPFAQTSWRWMAVVLHTTVDPATLAEPLRRVVMELRPDQPVMGIQTMEEALHDSLARRRFSMLLMGLFAVLALLLASVGIYGVMSYSMAQRNREIGIRIAVGAKPLDILKMVLRDGGKMLGMGLLTGVICALMLGQLLRGLLHEVLPTDPMTFLVALSILSMAAMLAVWIPARRALQVDPIASLRV